MNDYEKTIKDLQDRVRALEDRFTPCNDAGAVAEPEKWSPVGGDWWITSNQEVIPVTTSINCEMATLYGSRRPTLQQAERAVVEMRRFNRLLALRDELCGDDVPNWESKTSDKWRVYRDNKHGKWTVGKDRYMQDVGVYFTDRKSVV